MRRPPVREIWPLVGVMGTFLVTLAFAGAGAALGAAMLSVLAFGPAYLIQNGVRRLRGTFPPPPTKTPAERAQSDARFLRAAALAQLVSAVVAIVVLFAGRGSWLPGRGWTAWLVLVAAFGVMGAPHSWAIAERRATQRYLRWAWALAGSCDLAFGLAAATAAIGNAHGHWIGGSLWTIGLALLALFLLLGAPGDLARGWGR
jgi:hypothetical protein